MASPNQKGQPRPHKVAEHHTEVEITLVDEAPSTVGCWMPDAEDDFADIAEGAFVSPAQQFEDIEPLAGFDVARRAVDDAPPLGPVGGQPSKPQEQVAAEPRGLKLPWRFKRRS